MTLLAIDIGNTRLKWALYDAPRTTARLLAQGVSFLDHIDQLAESDWAGLPEPTHILGCVVAGDSIKRRVKDQLDIWNTPAQWVVPQAEEAGLSNGYDHPSRLGADRWAAMVGARSRMQAQGLSDRPMVVVMIGTAVTVDAVDGQGRFLGGLILPGHGIMLKALEAGTAGLHVPTGDVKPFPTNTSDALTSGGTYAIAGACERMVQHLQAHTGQTPVCWMSGGAGWKMAPSMSQPFELVEGLIFDGLLTLAQARFAP